MTCTVVREGQTHKLQQKAVHGKRRFLKGHDSTNNPEQSARSGGCWGPCQAEFLFVQSFGVRFWSPVPRRGKRGPRLPMARRARKGAAGPVVGSCSRFSGRRQWVRRHVRGRRLGPGLTVCILTAAPAENARWHLERHRTCAHSREAALGGRGQATQRNPQRKGNMRHVERDLAAAATTAAASAPASRAIYFLYTPPPSPQTPRREEKWKNYFMQRSKYVEPT